MLFSSATILTRGVRSGRLLAAGARVLALAACGFAAEPSLAAEGLSVFRFNQVGLEAGTPETVILVDPATAPIAYTVVDAAGKTVQQGVSVLVGDDAASGEHLHRMTLAALPAGSGYVIHAGTVQSRAFDVSAHPFARLRQDALGFFYQQRSGIAISADRVQRPDLARAAGHDPDIGHCFAGRDAKGVDWPGCSFATNATGGWYDAGDQGKYVVNGGVSVWALLNAYERDHAVPTPPRPERADADQRLLDEARWEIAFFLRMQIPAGTTLSLRHKNGSFSAVDASGLVFAKIADAAWTKIPTRPADDQEPRIVYPPTIAATLNFAAVTAQSARIWKTLDPAFAAQCLQASVVAYDAAQRLPDLDEDVATGGSGGYGDPKTADEQYWAAAELFATTGEARYRDVLRASPYSGKPLQTLSWSETETAGAASLALAATGPERDVARAQIVAAAEDDLADRAKTGYAIPFASLDYVWGSNSVILNRGLVLGLAYRLTGRPEFRVAERDALDYVLGRNALDQSYVSGYGARTMHHPHHRFWANQADPQFPEPPPGVIAGGPNSARGRGNMPDSMALTTACAPMACWHDDYRIFTENEVAINWNAPLFTVVDDLDR